MKHYITVIFCDRCGRYVAENWFVQHRKSECRVGATETSTENDDSNSATSTAQEPDK